MSNSISSIFGTASGLAGMLGDYAAIRNGSYGKLMRTYYGSGGYSSANDKTKTATNRIDDIIRERHNPKVSEEVSNANAKLNSAVSSMKSSLGTLQNESTYEDTAGGSTGRDKTTAALKNYVSAYNDAVESSKKTNNTAISSNIAGAMKASRENADALKELGITINSNGTLNLDEKKLQTADISKIKELFSADNALGYGGTVSSRVNRAGYYTASTTGASATTDSATTTANTQKKSDSLKTDIDTLISDSLFVKTVDDKGKASYNTDEVASAIQSFVKNYNDTISYAKNSVNSGVTSNLSAMMTKTSANATPLSTIGITVGYDGKLSFDGDKFADANMESAEKVLQSYGKSIQSNANLLNYYSKSGNGTASGYTAGGAYTSAGDMVNSLYNTTG